MLRKLQNVILIGCLLVSLSLFVDSSSQKTSLAQEGDYATHYGGFFSVEYPKEWETTEVETFDSTLVLFSPTAVNFQGEANFPNLMNDEHLQEALVDRPVAGLWIVSIENNDLYDTTYDGMDMPYEWAGADTREIMENGIGNLDIFKSERQRETIINSYEAVEALGTVRGQEHFAGRLFGVYSVMFRDSDYLYWFVGSALTDDFETVQADYEHMAHTIIRRADDLAVAEIEAPSSIEFTTVEGAGYSVDAPASWSFDTAENFDLAWIVFSPSDIVLTGDPSDIDIIFENDDVLAAMSHSPVAGMVKIKIPNDTDLDSVDLVEILEDAQDDINILRFDMQRHTQINGAEAVEVAGIVAGEGQFEGMNLGTYVMLAKTSTHLYYFAGVSPEENFEMYQLVFRYMAHRIEFTGFPDTANIPDADEPLATPVASSTTITAPTDPEFAVYAGIPHDASITQPAWQVEPDETVVEGVVRGVLDDGTPFIGSLDAPVVFAEFGDFSCPHCAAYEPEVQQLIDQYVSTGQLRIEFRPLTFVGGEFSVMAAQGAVCAAQQGAFWEFHSLLFIQQNLYGSASFTEDAMRDIAQGLGLDDVALVECMYSALPENVFRTTTQLQIDTGVNSTPTVIYRANESEDWQRFLDGSGNPTTRLSLAEMGQLISTYNE